MKREIRDRWTAALRSGEYEQGVGSFEEDGKHCALGVLCDVMGLPTTVRGVGNWGAARGLLEGVSPHDIAERNDSGGEDCEPMPFTHLADWIEENVPVEVI